MTIRPFRFLQSVDILKECSPGMSLLTKHILANHPISKFSVCIIDTTTYMLTQPHRQVTVNSVIMPPTSARQLIEQFINDIPPEKLKTDKLPKAKKEIYNDWNFILKAKEVSLEFLSNLLLPAGRAHRGPETNRKISCVTS